MSVDHYFSFPFRQIPGGNLMLDNVHSGTSSTPADYMELRWMADTGAGPTGVTRKDIIIFLDAAKAWIKRGGLLEDGTDVPPI
jgi:hypothetical protein